jgi:hypothetical protein
MGHRGLMVSSSSRMRRKTFRASKLPVWNSIGLDGKLMAAALSSHISTSLLPSSLESHEVRSRVRGAAVHGRFFVLRLYGLGAARFRDASVRVRWSRGSGCCWRGMEPRDRGDNSSLVSKDNGQGDMVLPGRRGSTRCRNKGVPVRQTNAPSKE